VAPAADLAWRRELGVVARLGFRRSKDAPGHHRRDGCQLSGLLLSGAFLDAAPGADETVIISPLTTLARGAREGRKTACVPFTEASEEAVEQAHRGVHGSSHRRRRKPRLFARGVGSGVGHPGRQAGRPFLPGFRYVWSIDLYQGHTLLAPSA
jgi:hypothetical protein